MINNDTCKILLKYKLWAKLGLLIVYRRDDEGDVIACLRDWGKGEVVALHHQDLAGEGETDARAMMLGGVERDKEVAVVLRENWRAVVADVETTGEPSERDSGGSCLGSILHYVYYCLSKEIGVDGYCQRIGDVDVPCKCGIHTGEAGDEIPQGNILWLRLLYLRHLAIAIHKGIEGGCCVVNSLDALAIWGGLEGGRGEIRLAYTEYGRCGIVYFVGEHTGEFLPRLHLVLGSQASYVVHHVVEGIKLGFLTKEHSFVWHTEGEITIAHSLTHEESPRAQYALMANEPHKQQNDYCQ